MNCGDVAEFGCQTRNDEAEHCTRLPFSFHQTQRCIVDDGPEEWIHLRTIRDQPHQVTANRTWEMKQGQRSSSQQQAPKLTEQHHKFDDVLVRIVGQHYGHSKTDGPEEAGHQKDYTYAHGGLWFGGWM